MVSTDEEDDGRRKVMEERFNWIHQDMFKFSQLFVYKRKMGAETLQTETGITKKSLYSSLLSNSIIAAANLLKKKDG
ncbi:hypothetical protein YC2023_070162 [Brassica napus]